MENRLQRQDVSARGDEWKVVQTSQLKPAPEQSGTRQPQLEQYLAESGARDARRLRMLHAVAHEVRNHLNAINLVATCLTKGADLNGNREDLAVLASNVRDIDALIEHLVDFANLLFGEDKLNPECLSLVDLHRDVAFVLRKMAEDKGLRFSGTVEQGLVEVVSDCLKLREIALNLGTNAVKYTPSGSVGLRFARHGSECWMLEVDDTGPGIPLQSREKIFEDFQRLPYFDGDGIRALRRIEALRSVCGDDYAGIKIILDLTAALERLRSDIRLLSRARTTGPAKESHRKASPISSRRRDVKSNYRKKKK